MENGDNPRNQKEQSPIDILENQYKKRALDTSDRLLDLKPLASNPMFSGPIYPTSYYCTDPKAIVYYNAVVSDLEDFDDCYRFNSAMKIKVKLARAKTAEITSEIKLVARMSSKKDDNIPIDNGFKWHYQNAKKQRQYIVCDDQWFERRC
jgi:hypothetical protein